jgi:uncharacterized protein (TIGR02996 family)
LLVSGPEQLDDTIWRPVVLALLRDIKANPDDDTPRFILADWLEEHGDTVRAARGEFLRLQCLAQRVPNPEREKTLLRRFEREWLGPLAPLAQSWSWQRGLLHLEIYADILLDDSADLVQSEAFGWVEGVSFRRLDAESVARLAASPWLGWLNTLDLGFNHIGDAGISILASSTNLTNLRSLWLRRNSIGDAGAAALACSAGLSKLDVLSLIDNQIGHAGARALSASPHLAHLKLLNLEGNPLGSAAIAGLKKIARAHPHLWLHIGRRWH